MKSDETDVVIVGAGPVGLTLAAALVRQQVPVTVMERLSVPSTEWRASTFHPPTLELLRGVDMTQEMLSRGLIAPTYQIRDRSEGMIAEFDLSVLKGDTEYPFRLQLEQYKYVEMLTERLQGNPLCTLVRGEAVTSVTDDGRGVTVSGTGSDGSAVSRRARYVVGADGARSAVRKSLGLDFPGLTYPVRFLIFSTSYPFEERFPDISLVNYIWDPVEPMMLLRIPDVWRIMFSIGAEAQEGDLRDPESVQSRMRKATGAGQDEQLPVAGAQYYQVHQRVAERFRIGRVLLIGDAAHVNSPVGGLGLNSGIHDAFDLAPRLAAHLAGAAPEDVLDVYAERRRRVAVEFVRKVTHRNTQMMTERDPELRKKNRLELQAIARDPERTREWMLDASMISGVRAAAIGL